MSSSPLAGPRCAGVLLHPTSLPGPGESGVLGAEALRFIEFLQAGGFRLWQMLPVGPVGDSLSPYQVHSAFAGNPRLIDPAGLRASGWLPPGPAGASWPERREMLSQSARQFRQSGPAAERLEFGRYWQAERAWLLPYALFCAARRRYGTSGWWTWPDGLRERQPAAIAQLLEASHAEVQETAFEQWAFDRQWHAIRRRAAEHGVELLGDLPIYVDLDSADVWWHRHLFQVDALGQPAAVAGVPPDYFSEDGQIWGNPLYAWEAHRRQRFSWWISRVRTQLARFDYLRIDHFRGLQAYWEIPPGATTARDGRWREAPGAALLAALGEAFGGQPFVAEDLGTITPEVHALRRQFGLPGMLVAQFAFDGAADNPYLPANQEASAFIYPGTHDNDTVAGWWQGLDARTRAYVRQVLGCDDAGAPQALLRSVWRSPAHTAIFPMQDLLGLGPEARMNIPATK